MPHALEMEDEDEIESLMYEVNGVYSQNGKNRKGLGSLSNGVSSTTASLRKGNISRSRSGLEGAVVSTTLSKMARVLFVLSAVAALLVLFHVKMSADEIDPLTVKPNNSSFPNSQQHVDDTANVAPQQIPPPPPQQQQQQQQQQKAFVYSNLATIVPDPDHVPVDDETRKAIDQEWGKWHFWDGDESTRPTADYCAAYPNRDIPGDEFPDEAWQVDAVFVNHFLNDAEQLVSRAMEAIFTEYGHGKPLPPEKLAERMRMFHWDYINMDAEKVEPSSKFIKTGDKGIGGWTTDRSTDGLIKRLLHAMMTNDTFTVVLAGHSAAAGHGNHFRQSYMMQFHKIMAPILARLGVKLVTRNLSQGGLGTIQNSIGAGYLYGDEIDLFLWEAGMTETDPAHIDLSLRQSMIGGNRVPVVWGGHFNILVTLYKEAEADVGDWGTAMDGIPEVTSETQADTLPFATRYLKCSQERKDLCQDAPRFCTHCWIDRPDLNREELFDNIEDEPNGQVKWHPGWRFHQLIGRLLAFKVLDALQVAIQIWSDGTMGGPPLDDEWWHVTDYYSNIRTKIQNMPPDVGKCHNIVGTLPTRLCNTPMQARSLFTPRNNPAKTSLSTIIRATADGYIPQNEEKMMYEGPDVHNTCMNVPHDAIDVLAIVSGRRTRQVRILNTSPAPVTSTFHGYNHTLSRELKSDAIVPGNGWQIVDEPPGQCDGEYYSICGRQRSDPCPMIGHHDARGALIGNEWSGWLVLDLPNLEKGLIILKIVTYMDESVNTRTAGWTSVNNERKLLLVEEGDTQQEFQKSNNTRRTLFTVEKDLPETFIFDYAIDGQITSLNREKFISLYQQPQRLVETLTLLDDPNFTSTARNVEVAFRMRNCGRICTFALSHVYWA